MPEAEPFLIFTRKLSQLGLSFMVSGSVAAIFYGEPRMTNDVDIVLVLPRDELLAFSAAFPLEEFYCPPHDVLRLEQAREERGHLNLIHHETGFKADIYLARKDSLHEWGLKNVRIVSIDVDAVPLAPPEYVIVRKLQFYREGRAEKHLRDISRMVVALGEDWDGSTLARLIGRYGLEEEWGSAQRSGD